MKRLLAVLTLMTLIIPNHASGYIQDTRDSNSPFGVLSFLSWNHGWNSGHYSGERVETAIQLMQEAGVGFVRMDFLWDDIEYAPGRFNFEKYDRIVELLDKHDIKILGLLSYNASWAAEYWNSPPNRTLFARYAQAVVHRYKSKVKYWEIWNEPDHQEYWRVQDNMKSYVGLLKVVTPVIKKEDPTSVVVLGGLSKSISHSLRNIYREGGRDFFDIVNIHPFVDPRATNPISAVRGIYQNTRRVMDQFKDSEKPIWITELGCPGLKERDNGTGWWLGHAPTEDEQARWVSQVYSEVLQWEGVDKVFWAFFRDTPNYFKNGIDYFGLVRNDFSKKPAFRTYQRMTQVIR